MVEHRPDSSGGLDTPTRDRTERLIRAIMCRAAPELNRRRPLTSVAFAMSRWQRSVLTGAAGLAAAAFCAVLLVDTNGGEIENVEPLLPEAVLPAGIAEWLSSTDEVNAFLIVAAFEEVSR